MAQYPHIMIGEKTEKKFLGLRYQAVKKINVDPQNLEKCLSDFFLAQRSPLLFICPDNQKFSDGIRKGNVQYIYHAAGLKTLDKNQREFQAGLKNILDRRITVPATQAAFLPIGYYGPIDHFPGGEFTIDLDEIAAKIEILPKNIILEKIAPFLLEALIQTEAKPSDNGIFIGDDACGYYAYYEV